MNIGHIGKSRQVTGKGRKYIKISTSKRRRRMGKMLLDNAPKIVTVGWAD